MTDVSHHEELAAWLYGNFRAYTHIADFSLVRGPSREVWLAKADEWLSRHPVKAASPEREARLGGLDKDQFEGLVGDLMNETWCDICLDTGFHPLDIDQPGRKRLEYRPRHWTSYIAGRLFAFLSNPPASEETAALSLPIQSVEGESPEGVLRAALTEISLVPGRANIRVKDMARECSRIARAALSSSSLTGYGKP